MRHHFLTFFIFVITIACSNNNAKIQDSLKDDTIQSIDLLKIKKDIRAYTHIHDTITHNRYDYQPDSLYYILCRYQSDHSLYTETINLIDKSSQGKCFKKKMLEMKELLKYKDIYGLPTDSRVIEIKVLDKNIVDGGRILILWMLNPYLSIDFENIYTCPEYTSGKAFFEGKAFISLVSTKSKKVINTLPFNEDKFSTIDTIGNIVKHTYHVSSIIPVSSVKRIRSGGAMSGKYFSRESTDSTDGPVQILYLEDYNKDGYSLEFPMFSNLGCAGTSTTLYGYSIKQDKVIHYSICETVYIEGMLKKDSVYSETVYWIYGLFTLKPEFFPRNFAIDFRGRGGDYERHHVTYNSDKEIFNDTVDLRPKSEDKNTRSSWVPLIE